VYFSREPNSEVLGGRLNFLKFETDGIEQCLDFIQRLKSEQQTLNGSKPDDLCVMATGGGAYKYYDRMKEVLGVEVLREDEMECLIIGWLTAAPKQTQVETNSDRFGFLHYRNSR
jgi:type II pantothenate kinase